MIKIFFLKISPFTDRIHIYIANYLFKKSTKIPILLYVIIHVNNSGGNNNCTVLVSPKIHVHPEPVNVTSFGNKVLGHRIKLR